MFRKSFVIMALSLLPASLSAQGTNQQALDAAVRAGACSPQGISSAAYQADGSVRVVCNRTGSGAGGAGAAAAVVILAALGGGSSTTTSSTTGSSPSS